MARGNNGCPTVRTKEDRRAWYDASERFCELYSDISRQDGPNSFHRFRVKGVDEATEKLVSRIMQKWNVKMSRPGALSNQPKPNFCGMGATLLKGTKRKTRKPSVFRIFMERFRSLHQRMQVSGESVFSNKGFEIQKPKSMDYTKVSHWVKEQNNLN